MDVTVFDEHGHIFWAVLHSRTNTIFDDWLEGNQKNHAASKAFEVSSVPVV